MNRLINLNIILFSLIFLDGSCKLSLKKDLSYTPKEYRMKGMPDQDSIWTDRNYIKAYITLSKTRAGNFLSLPRKRSKKSAAIFSRIISKENMSFLNDTAETLSNKAFRIQHLSSLITDVSRIYTDDLRQEQFYNEELIDLYIFRLFVQEKMLELADEIMNSKDPSVMGMREGLIAVQQGYLNLINVLLEEQVKSNKYHSDDLERLSGEISHSLLNNLKWMDQDSREKITNQIQRALDKSSSDLIKEDLWKTLNVFKKRP
jgi:hypothetical protein